MFFLLAEGLVLFEGLFSRVMLGRALTPCLMTPFEVYGLWCGDLLVVVFYFDSDAFLTFGLN